uniref:amphiregulin n=1 Tax=Euleptes europaea TaxID=460621 RepID=UPI0025403634|nr:amphiregulin [Euleptes europaea]
MAHQPDVPILRILSAPGAEMPLSRVEYEETEEEGVKELVTPQWLVDDPGRVESQLKKPALSESGKRNRDKPKKGERKGKKKKKKNREPCEGDFKNFCIHGECKYIEHLQIPTCKCHPNYYGERCVEQFLKSHRSNEAVSQSTAILVVVAVVFSVFSFAAIVVVVIMQVRKKYPKCEEKEEKKKLRQENGSPSNERDEVEEAVGEAHETPWRHVFDHLYRGPLDDWYSGRETPLQDQAPATSTPCPREEEHCLLQERNHELTWENRDLQAQLGALQMEMTALAGTVRGLRSSIGAATTLPVHSPCTVARDVQISFDGTCAVTPLSTATFLLHERSG